jgi:pRiA4b ORF-3-like protein
VTRRLRVAEQISLAELHAALQPAFGWSDWHLHTFQVRGRQFGDPARAIELALAGGGVDIPRATFGFEIGEPELPSLIEDPAGYPHATSWYVP